MQRTSFETTLAGLDEVFALFRQWGRAAELEGSRFLEYRRRLQRFVDLRAEPERLNEDAPLGSDGDRAIAGFAQVEGSELAGFLSFLKTCEPDVLVPKARVVLGGPVLPSDENQASNQARNIMFEINLASKLHRAGLGPQLGEHPDLRCEVEGKQLWIECKRPLAAANVGKRISQAHKQLHRDMKAAPPGTRGVIAISLSKVVNDADGLLAYSDEARASAFLAEQLEQLATRWQRSRSHRDLPPSIVGMLFHVMTPALHRETGIMVLADQVNIHERARPGTADHRAFHRFGKVLESLADHRG